MVLFGTVAYPDTAYASLTQHLLCRSSPKTNSDPNRHAFMNC
jgi:hypothetical protein